MGRAQPIKRVDWDVKQVANSGGDQVEADSFWWLATVHGYTAQPKEANSKQLTPTSEKLLQLEKCAEDLKTTKVDFNHRLPIIRKLAKELEISMRDQELAKMLDRTGKSTVSAKYLDRVILSPLSLKDGCVMGFY